MSTIAERAREEADRVEAELAAEAALEEPVDEPPAEPAELAAVASGPTDADLRKFEKENERHERALEKIVGDDWSDFEACGVCGGVGHVPAATNANVPFERDPQTAPCEVCKGYGTTLTGAKEPGMVTRACSRCQGSGWTAVEEHPEAGRDFVLEPHNGGADVHPVAPAPPNDPAVEALRARGYIVVEPPSVAPAPGS